MLDPAIIRSIRFLSHAAVLLLPAACGGPKYQPPSPAVSRTATPVSASQGKTWDAVIDVFAERNIPIRNMERASGFIVTEDLGLTHVDSVSVRWADCGTTPINWSNAKKKPGQKSATKRRAVPPTRATYNVLVRGDSSHSTVKVTVRWTTSEVTTYPRECSTKGTWETEAEADIRSRAEGSKAAAGPPRRVDDLPSGTNWVADAKNRTYYPVGCPASAKITAADRLYYGSESALHAAGFKKSSEC